MTFRVVPISSDVADFVRTHLRSPRYGHPATVERATGYGPCRQCLRVFREGHEDRILFTYNPVPDAAGIPQPGPVFIHFEPCEPFDLQGFPPELRGLPMFLEGLGRDSWLIRRAPVAADGIESSVAEMFRDPAIDRVQLRNAEAGCFIAAIERAELPRAVQ
jgi:hypothetical protein